jgi:hypothetical protein
VCRSRGLEQSPESQFILCLLLTVSCLKSILSLIQLQSLLMPSLEQSSLCQVCDYKASWSYIHVYSFLSRSHSGATASFLGGLGSILGHIDRFSIPSIQVNWRAATKLSVTIVEDCVRNKAQIFSYVIKLVGLGNTVIPDAHTDVAHMRHWRICAFLMS